MLESFLCNVVICSCTLKAKLERIIFLCFKLMVADEQKAVIVNSDMIPFIEWNKLVLEPCGALNLLLGTASCATQTL